LYPYSDSIRFDTNIVVKDVHADKL
jgi:hypothetical protein